MKLNRLTQLQKFSGCYCDRVSSWFHSISNYDHTSHGVICLSTYGITYFILHWWPKTVVKVHAWPHATTFAQIVFFCLFVCLFVVVLFVCGVFFLVCVFFCVVVGCFGGFFGFSLCVGFFCFFCFLFFFFGTFVVLLSIMIKSIWSVGISILKGVGGCFEEGKLPLHP